MVANKYASEARAAKQRYRVWRSCTSKRPYQSEQDAKANWHLEGQRIYRCAVCSLWHRTSGIRTTLARVRRVRRNA